MQSRGLESKRHERSGQRGPLWLADVLILFNTVQISEGQALVYNERFALLHLDSLVLSDSKAHPECKQK